MKHILDIQVFLIKTLKNICVKEFINYFCVKLRSLIALKLPMSDKQMEEELVFFFNHTIKAIRQEGLSGMRKINNLIQINKASYPIVDFIFTTVCDDFGLEKEDLIKSDIRGMIVFARKLVICLCDEHASLTVKEISREMNRTRQVIHCEKREISQLCRKNKIDAWFFEKYDKLNPIIAKYVEQQQKSEK